MGILPVVFNNNLDWADVSDDEKYSIVVNTLFAWEQLKTDIVNEYPNFDFTDFERKLTSISKALSCYAIYLRDGKNESELINWFYQEKTMDSLSYLLALKENFDQWDDSLTTRIDGLDVDVAIEAIVTAYKCASKKNLVRLDMSAITLSLSLPTMRNNITIELPLYHTTNNGR